MDRKREWVKEVAVLYEKWGKSLIDVDPVSRAKSSPVLGVVAYFRPVGLLAAVQ